MAIAGGHLKAMGSGTGPYLKQGRASHRSMAPRENREAVDVAVHVTMARAGRGLATRTAAARPCRVARPRGRGSRLLKVVIKLDTHDTRRGHDRGDEWRVNREFRA